MTLNKILFDSTIELHLDIERVAIESRATVVSMLKAMEIELTDKLARGVTDWSKARINAQLKEADAVIKQYYNDIATTSQNAASGVAQVAASATADSLVVAVGAQVAVSAIPTAAYLNTLASNTIIQGAVQADWWARQSADTAFKFQSAVRQGLVAAETTPQIVKRVREVLDLSRRNVETLVHTSVQSVANTTREKIFEDNTDVVSGKEWCSALDRKTCFVKNTMVSVPKGLKPIDKLKVGDIVIGGSGEHRKVIGSMKSKANKVAKITFSNGETVICTQDHRFMIESGKWVEAIDLKQGFKMK